MALKEKEKLFCSYYSELRNARSAAAKAGYGILTQRNAAKLMNRKDIQKEIEKLDKTKALVEQDVIAGYRQLAFGSVTDALKLVCSDSEPRGIDIETLDLFNISEIKKPKGGGLEIKFFDRLKALEHLEELSKIDSGDSSAMPFYRALEKSAEALKDDVNE